jgi:hypothetical protein
MSWQTVDEVGDHAAAQVVAEALAAYDIPSQLLSLPGAFYGGDRAQPGDPGRGGGAGAPGRRLVVPMPQLPPVWMMRCR